MSVHARLILYCQTPGCTRTFTGDEIDRFPMRYDLAATRAAAAAVGWLNKKPHGDIHYGDFCPSCAVKIVTDRPIVKHSRWPFGP